MRPAPLRASTVATSADTVLWTDDLILGVIGKSDFQTQRVWTQAVMLALRKEGEVTPQEFDQSVAKLVGCHYHGVLLDEDTLVAAAEVAGWRMDHWPVPAVMKTLANTNVDPVGRLRVAAQAIRAVWRRELTSAERNGFLFATLDALQSVRLVQRLLHAVPQLFGVDVLSAGDVRAGIATWLRTPSTKLVLP